MSETPLMPNRSSRRKLLLGGINFLGGAALSTLLQSCASIKSPLDTQGGASSKGPIAGLPHFPPRARNVIHLTMMGGPPQLDLFDYKPNLDSLYDRDLPASVIQGQRLTTMTSGQRRFPIAPSKYRFSQHGQSGAWITELLPNLAKCVDDICLVRSVKTPAINHESGISLLQTGDQRTGKPSIGSWIGYGLGSESSDLPAYVVLLAQCTNTEQVQALSSGLWSAGNLPGKYHGVLLRTGLDPILYLGNPQGLPREIRRQSLDSLSSLNELNYRRLGDPSIHTRIDQYELAFRMQASMPELAAVANEPESIFKLYGSAAKMPGTFARSALMARRMVERGVRYVQIIHNNWDTHSNTAGRLPAQCMDIDQACYGLIEDLKQRGLLESTLVIWGGEFGRTVYCQGDLSRQNYGRDHHGNCFTMWFAGGGIKPGIVYGETDEFSFNVVSKPVTIHDIHATALRLLGIDHERFTFNFQGLESRLTGVDPARVITEIL